MIHPMTMSVRAAILLGALACEPGAARAQGMGAIEVLERRAQPAREGEPRPAVQPDAPPAPAPPTPERPVRPTPTAERLRGAWLIAGEVSWRYVWGADAAPRFEDRIDDLGEVVAEGRATATGFTLLGSAQGGERWAPRELRIVGREDGRDALEVTFDVRDDETCPWACARRERWCRPGPAEVEIVAARGLGPDLSYDPSAPLELIVEVRGRPTALALQVLAAEDDARYAPLDGIVHHELVQDGQLLPIGQHRVSWSGRDRSWREAPVQAGRYTLVVAAHQDGAGPPPGGEPEAPARHAVEIVVPAPAPTAVAAAPVAVQAARRR